METHDFATQVRAGRAKKGWRQEDLALASGVHPTTISRIERGATPTPNNRRAILQALGLETAPAISGEFVYLPWIGSRRKPDGEIEGGAMAAKVVGFRPQWLSVKSHGHTDSLAMHVATKDDMAPSIQRGDQVMIDRHQTTPEENGLFAVAWYGEIILRRLRRATGGVIELVCDNLKHASQPVPSGDEALEIIGKVVWLGRELS